MLIPAEIEHPYERTAYATYALIGACVATFVLQFVLPDAVLAALALDPRAFAPHQLITSGFLHVGLLHLIGNLLFLGVYGRYVEDRLGPARFLGLYLACGVSTSRAARNDRPSAPRAPSRASWASSWSWRPGCRCAPTSSSDPR
jgi:membrane associated rhomboid family serine protease